MKYLLTLCVTALAVCVPGSCADKQYTVSAGSDGQYRAQQTLNGLMDYYWSHDPTNKNISFFFVCGQIGAGGNSDWTKCSCASPDPCATCYRWWDAVAVESIATYGVYANTSNHSSIASTVFAYSPYNSDWNGLVSYTYIDDFAWYGIAYLRVYEWLNVSNTANFTCV